MTLPVVLRNLWIVLLVANVALLAAIAATSQATPQYRSQGTYVIGPAPGLTSPETIIRSFDSLQGQGIVPTLVELLSSGTIAGRVAERLGLDAGDLELYDVRANVLSSSNTLELTVTGPDPEITQELATGIGREASSVFERLYSVYQIEPLDVPRQPQDPFSPSLVRNAALAFLLGLTAGGVIAFLRERDGARRPGAALVRPTGSEHGAEPPPPPPDPMSDAAPPPARPDPVSDAAPPPAHADPVSDAAPPPARPVPLNDAAGAVDHSAGTRSPGESTADRSVRPTAAPNAPG